MAFLTLGAMQLSVALALRARPGTWENPFLCLLSAQPGCCRWPRYICRRWQNSSEPNAPPDRSRGRYGALIVGLRRYPAGPKAAPAIDQPAGPRYGPSAPVLRDSRLLCLSWLSRNVVAGHLRSGADEVAHQR